MPQLICLVDCSGTVIHANRTFERWGLGEVETAKGTQLHDLVHPRCADARCYLRSFWKQAEALLTQTQCVLREVWDPLLERHLEICARAPLPDQDADPDERFVVVTFDDSKRVRTEEALHLMRDELRRLSAQHLTIQESERRRIAVDLHDSLGQTLSLLKLSIEDAARSANAGVAAKAAATLDRLTPTVKSALAELRRISMNLRPSTLDDLGILATLSWYCREFEATCPSIKLEREVGVAESEVPQLLKISIFRIVQEATGNALKHARADRIKVSLTGDETQLALAIEDNGCGFDAQAAAASRDFNHGLGLQSMKERAELSGGTYTLESSPGAGTRIRVHWSALQAADLPPQAYMSAPPEAAAESSGLPERYEHCIACIREMRRK